MRVRKDNDYIGPSRGWAKLMHRLVMLILWPLRRPVLFVVLVVILFLAPTFMGVKPMEVHHWYWNKIKSSSSEVKTMVADKTKEMLPNMPKVEMPSIKVSSTSDKTVPAAKVVDMPVKEGRRKMFEKAKSAPVAIDIMQQKSQIAEDVVKSSSLSQTEAGVSQPSTPKDNNQQPAPAKKKLALVYVKEPKFIFGPGQVINANELNINGESIFLYGIYVDPNTDKGQEAKVYLQKTIAAQPVNCRVEAYTYQGIATAICVVNGINLNKALVENGYSKNVSLD